MNTLISKEHNGLIKVIIAMHRAASRISSLRFKGHLLLEGVDEGHIIEMAFGAFEHKKYCDPEVLYPYLHFILNDNSLKTKKLSTCSRMI